MADRGACGWKNLSETPASGTPRSGSIVRAAFGSIASRLLADAAIMDNWDGLRAERTVAEGRDKPGRCGDEDGEWKNWIGGSAALLTVAVISIAMKNVSVESPLEIYKSYLQALSF